MVEGGAFWGKELQMQSINEFEGKYRIHMVLQQVQFTRWLVNCFRKK